MVKVLKWTIITLICSISMTGCGFNNNHQDSIYEEADYNGMKMITNDQGRRGRDLRDDPINTNQSPTSYIDPSEDMPTLGTDIDKAKWVIENETEYEPGPVMINGQDMWVRVYHKGMMSQEERVKEEAAVHKLLIKALPRYYIEVKMQEDRR